MSNFNKKEYVLEYNKNNRTWIRVNVSNEDKDKFDAYCTKINVKSSTYIKNLINEDAIKNGYEPLFSDKRRKQKSDEFD